MQSAIFSLTFRYESLDQCGRVIFIIVKILVQINFYTCHLHVCCFLIKEVGCFKKKKKKKSYCLLRQGPLSLLSLF